MVVMVGSSTAGTVMGNKAVVAIKDKWYSTYAKWVAENMQVLCTRTVHETEIMHVLCT
jgi:hypothetical protein